jgi:Branched-chain amino acid transport protein (AzlD)
MSPLLLATVAIITYTSRAAALVFMPQPRGRFAAILARMPGPIFASLATLTLVTDDQTLTDGRILCAALGALIASPKRSLAFCLIGGLAGYLLGEALL